jgi:hypothetical protein
VVVLIFFLGALLGLVVGVIGCVRYVRQELTARIGPTMDLMQLQLDNVQSAVNLALASWHAQLHDHAMAHQSVTRQDRNPAA